MCIIYWKELTTELIGHGEIVSCELAQLAVKYANEAYTDIIHWIAMVV